MVSCRKGCFADAVASTPGQYKASELTSSPAAKPRSAEVLQRYVQAERVLFYMNCTSWPDMSGLLQKPPRVSTASGYGTTLGLSR